jgi:hypothetical protein
MNPNMDKNLESNAKRAITTAFIGAIAEVEKQLGYIWGQDKEPAKMTESECYFFDLWQQIRNNIMDAGNKQCRIIEKEFKKYAVKYTGEFHVFKMKPRTRENQ